MATTRQSRSLIDLFLKFVFLDPETRLRLEPTRYREILLAQMNLDGANVKSVTTPAMKMQEWTPQMLTEIDKDLASTF